MRNLKDLLNKHHAVLAGGTALALHMGHRISVDLDFFTDAEFRVESMISYLRKISPHFRLISEGEDFLTAYIDDIKVSIFKYDYPFLEKQTTYKGVKIASILDIASMKVIAISQRGTKRDFVDLYFILQDTPFHKVAEYMIKRFGRERINPVHVGKSLVYFSDADSNPEPLYMKGKKVEWETVMKFFRLHVKQFVFDLDATIKDSDNCT